MEAFITQSVSTVPHAAVLTNNIVYPHLSYLILIKDTFDTFST
jgi:hypothetical protein